MKTCHLKPELPVDVAEQFYPNSHQELVAQGKLDLQQLQADELYGKPICDALR